MFFNIQSDLCKNLPDDVRIRDVEVDEENSALYVDINPKAIIVGMLENHSISEVRNLWTKVQKESKHDNVNSVKVGMDVLRKSKANLKTIEKRSVVQNKEPVAHKEAAKVTEPPKQTSNKQPVNKVTNPPKEPVNKVTNPPKEPVNKVTNPPKEPVNRVTNPPKEPVNKATNPPKEPVKVTEPPKETTNKQPVDKATNSPKEPVNKATNPPKEPVNKVINPPKESTNKQPVNKDKEPINADKSSTNGEKWSYEKEKELFETYVRTNRNLKETANEFYKANSKDFSVTAVIRHIREKRCYGPTSLDHATGGWSKFKYRTDRQYPSKEFFRTVIKPFGKR